MPKQDPALRDKIIEQYAVWRSITKVAEVVHCSRSCVQGTLKRNGVKLNSRGAQPGERNHKVSCIPHEQIEEAGRMYSEGFSEPEIADVFGVTHSAMARRLDIAGVDKRERGESLRLRFARRPQARSKSGR